MTRIYLVRHAEAEGNLYRIAHGHYNGLITARGYKQIAALQQRFEHIHIDAVYSSDLFRTRTTARAVYLPKGLPLHTDPNLREVNMGVWEGHTWQQLRMEDEERIVDFNRHLDRWQVPGGETAQQVLDRFIPALTKIALENDGKTVAVFSHGAALRMVLGTLEGRPLSELGSTPHGDNTAISLVEYDEDGFTVLYEEATDEKEKKETNLPPLEQGQVLKLKELKSEQKFTQPPARYTEATLIKALEENGIGRPSTYAPIITTIIDRGYVERDQKKLKPTLLGRAVDGLMLEQFPHIVDVDFSAEMEKNLDKVESGKTDWHKTVDDFYKGFAASLEQAEKNMEGKKVKVPDEPSSEVCDLCGRPMVIKVGKYGKFLACSGFPECRGTKRLVKDTGGICPKCGKGRMLERKSAKGRIYYGCERYPDCDFMTWDMPVAVKCEKCGSTLFRKGSKLYCAKEGCDFEMPVPKKD